MRGRIRGGKFMMPGVHRVTRNGRTLKYHRATKMPLPNNIPEDHPDFIAAWNAAQTSTQIKSKAPKGTVEHACIAYLASREHLSLSDGYRPVIRRNIESIRRQCEDAAHSPLLRHLTPAAVKADLAPLTPAVASSRLKAWRKLAKFCEGNGYTTSDFTAGVKRKPLPKTDGHIPWTREDLKAFRDHWPIGTQQRLACELLQWTGARTVDLVKLGPQMIDRDGLLTFRQQKTKVLAHVPWHTDAHGLKWQMDDLLKCVDRTSLVYLRTASGKPRSAKSVSAWFSKAATDAGLPDLSAHGLRKYRMIELAEAGTPILAMQSWVGHLTIEEVQEYTEKADRRRVHLLPKREKL